MLPISQNTTDSFPKPALPLRRMDFYALFRRYAQFDTNSGDFGVSQAGWDKFIHHTGLSGDGGLYHGDHWLVFQKLNVHGQLDFTRFKTGLTTLRDRLQRKSSTQSPLITLMIDEEQAGQRSFPKSVAADPDLLPSTNTTRSVIREVLPTPSARSSEGMRLLGGCLSLYNRAKFDQAVKALHLARAAFQHDAAEAASKGTTSGGEEPATPLVRSGGELGDTPRDKSSLPPSVSLYFFLLEVGILISQQKMDEAGALMKRSKEAMQASSGHPVSLAGYHIEGLLAYHRGNFQIAAEYFNTVTELGYNLKGPMIEEALVAAGNNMALCEELMDNKLKALHTMKELNNKIQKMPTQSGKASTQTVLRNIFRLHTTPVAVTPELLAMHAGNATVIASPRSTPLKVGPDNSTFAFLQRLATPKAVDPKAAAPPKKKTAAKKGKDGKKPKKVKKPTPMTAWGQEFVAGLPPRYSFRNIPITLGKKAGDKKGKGKKK